jgi:hypothetical protein
MEAQISEPLGSVALVFVASFTQDIGNSTPQLKSCTDLSLLFLLVGVARWHSNHGQQNDKSLSKLQIDLYTLNCSLA